MLEIRDLSFSYPTVSVLDRVDLGLTAGTLRALFGPNGTGKTTLFRCVLGLLDPAPGGQILVDGTDIQRLTATELARLVAYVPQEHRPPFPYSVFDVVLMGRTPHLGGVFGPTRADRAIAVDAIEQIGIGPLTKRPYTALSGGQRQLVLLARALAQEARLLLLDEPTASLDFGNQLAVWRTVRRLTSEGRAALICTHDPNHVLWFCDEVSVLDRDGTIHSNGTPQHVINDELVTHLYGPVSRIMQLPDRSVALPHRHDTHPTHRPN